MLLNIIINALFILNIAYHFDAATISLLGQWNAIIIIQIELKPSIYICLYLINIVFCYISIIIRIKIMA